MTKFLDEWTNPVMAAQALGFKKRFSGWYDLIKLFCWDLDIPTKIKNYIF